MSIYFVLVFLVITAILGVVLYSYVAKAKKRPIFLVAIKGVMGIASWSVMTYYVSVDLQGFSLGSWSNTLSASYAFFSFGATLGLFMMVKDKFLGQDLPKWMAQVHAGINGIGFIFLIIYILTGTSGLS